jgi:outer membrane assembly lipoprotein YfiO
VRSRTGVALGCAVALLGAGCHHFDPRSYTSPEALYRASMRQFRTGHFDRAQAGFQALTFNVGARDTLYPLARYFLAESYFGQGDFLAAAREFRRVSDETPEYRLAPDALLRAGDSYAKLWTQPQLDPGNGQTALATYRELQGRYPDAAATRIAAARVRQLTEEFARKELENAEFYFQRGAYDSAILYFKDLIASYSSSSVVPIAYVYLARSYQAIGYREELTETCAFLRQNYARRADVRRYCGDGLVRR